jgi:hypothetical protein
MGHPLQWPKCTWSARAESFPKIAGAAQVRDGFPPSFALSRETAAEWNPQSNQRYSAVLPPISPNVIAITLGCAFSPITGLESQME